MRIKYKFLICFAFITAMFSSCGDNNDAGLNSKPGEITFVSGLNKYATRLSQNGNQWTSGDQIGIYMVTSGTTTVLDYSNVPYEAESSAQTTAFKAGGASIYYPTNGAAVDFMAYYPYSSAITDMTYPVSLADQSVSLAANDLLYATANNSGNGFTEGSISFGFTHQLSKITLNLVDESGNAITPDTDGIVIKGMNTTAGFDLKTGTLSNAAHTASITPYNNSNSFEAILLPFTIASGHEVIIVVNGNQYLWSMSNKYLGMEIKTGYSYIFKLMVKTSDAEVDAIFVDYDGNSISPWGDGGADNKKEEPTEDIEIPADYEKIELSSGESISSALSGTTSPKVAIVLADGGSYSESSGFEIPNTITSLMWVGKGGTTTPSVYIANSMKATGNMDLIHLHNIEISGIASSSYFMNQNVEVTIQEILIENTTIHDVRGVLRLQSKASTINLLKVTNSIIYNIGNYNLLTVDVDGSSIPSIEVKKTTMYNIVSRLIYFNKTTVEAPTVTIDQCTFHLGPYYAITQFNGTSSGSLTFTNNIVGLPYDISDTSLGQAYTSERGMSIRSNGATASETNNYYVSNTIWQGSVTTGTDCGYTAAELFADPDNGNFTQSKLEVGDPRWY